MPDIFNVPTISVSQVRPPVTIFDTVDGDLSDITGSSIIKRGSENFSIPEWAKCGVAVVSDCGCYPKPYSEKYCHLEDYPIATNYDEGEIPSEIPLSMIYQGGSLEVTAQPKTYTPREGCCRYLFRPLAQYLRLKEKFRCEKNLQAKTLNYLQAYSHRLLVDQLMHSKNGNVSVPMVANDVTPLDDNGNPEKVADCVALSLLQENHGNLRTLIAPMSAVNVLLAQGLIARDSEGVMRVISSGTRVLTDPAWKGKVGPPVAGPWNGSDPFNPATDLPVITPEEDTGCVWLYMTGPVYVSQHIEPSSLPKQNGDEDTKGNTDTALAELQTIGVFDPCDVTAVLMNVNKAVECG